MNKQLTLIIGPAGSGKTTLLSLMRCVIFPTSGEVYTDNILINNLNDKELAGDTLIEEIELDKQLLSGITGR